MTRVTFLGTGTSNGVPVIGCGCPVCRSKDPRDKRWRSSILIEKGDTRVVVDTGYEFRLQCLRAGIDRLDAVLYTHEHPDHTFGLDDLRVFCSTDAFPVYGTGETLDRIEAKNAYAFRQDGAKGVPRLRKMPVEPHVPFRIGELEFIPLVGDHYRIKSTGYRFGTMAYVTDMSDVRLNENKRILDGVDTLIIGALRKDPHVAHLTFPQALEVGRSIGANRILFTHMGHYSLHEDILKDYYPSAEPAYDTLVVEAED